MLGADNLVNFTCRLIRNSGSLNLLEPDGPEQGLTYLLPLRYGTKLNLKQTSARSTTLISTIYLYSFINEYA